MNELENRSTLIPLREEKDGSVAVMGRDLHVFLEIKTPYKQWFERVVEFGFEESKDFVTISQSKITKQKNKATYTNHEITLGMAKAVCTLNSRNAMSAVAYKYLCSISNGNVFVLKQPRKEHQFEELLEKITGIEWLKQYPIDGGKYRLDFYLPSVLIIEYDENHHKYQADMDIERIDYCREWLNEYGDFESFDEKWRIPVIRIQEGEELEGINRIIKHLVGFSEISDKDYNLEPCDIGNRRISRTPKVTGKGQQYFINKFLKNDDSIRLEV